MVGKRELEAISVISLLTYMTCAQEMMPALNASYSKGS